MYWLWVAYLYVHVKSIIISRSPCTLSVFSGEKNINDDSFYIKLTWCKVNDDIKISFLNISVIGAINLLCIIQIIFHINLYPLGYIPRWNAFSELFSNIFLARCCHTLSKQYFNKTQMSKKSLYLPVNVSHPICNLHHEQIKATLKPSLLIWCKNTVNLEREGETHSVPHQKACPVRQQCRKSSVNKNSFINPKS